MSHCNFLECDIYMYNNINGGISCHVADGRYFNFKTRSEAINQLKKLSETLDVPERVFKRLESELSSIGETSRLEPTTNYQLQKFLETKELFEEIKEIKHNSSEKTFLGIPIIYDPNMPKDTIETRSKNGIIQLNLDINDKEDKKC